jgi:hypothetical protein
MEMIGRNPQYLGDGVYASFDGYQTWLQTLEGYRIALEPAVMAALIAYDKQQREAPT